MTWHTELGDRCLTGPEARLVREIVDYMHDVIGSMLDVTLDDDDEIVEYGVPEFDKLSSPQKIALLEQVLRQMLTAAEAPPALTVINESAIAAIYKAIEETVLSEIEMESDLNEPGALDPHYWRKLLLDVARADVRDSTKLPDAACRDEDEWESILESIRMRVLWDDDYMDAEAMLDATPQSARRHRRKFGIDNDYYIAVAPDPSESELPAIRERLRTLCRTT